MVLSGIDAVRQRVIERLRYHVGEWYLDLADGVPYRDGDDPILSHVRGYRSLRRRGWRFMWRVLWLASSMVRVTVTVQDARLDRATRRIAVRARDSYPERGYDRGGDMKIYTENTFTWSR